MSKIRILLADDNRRVLNYVGEFLSRNGYEVIGAVADGQPAVDAAARLVPDVLVLDVSMPILNGIQVARLVLEANPSLKIVFLTICGDPEICRAAMETGACGYVLKPRLASDLLPAIGLAKIGRSFVSPGCT